MNELWTVPGRGHDRRSRNTTPALGVRGTLPGALLLLTCLLTATSVLATPPAAVPGITPSRTGDDLIISWSALSGADGYRVYKATDAACSNVTVVYTGTALSYAAAGAFLDTTANIYAVAAFAGSEEGPRSLPIYEYTLDFPAPTPGAASGRLFSVPSDPGPGTSLELCRDVNRGTPPSLPFRYAFKSVPSIAGRVSQPCSPAAKNVFSLNSAESYVLRQNEAGTATAWGQGESATISFDVVYDSTLTPSPEGCDRGLYQASLPWDHDYADLAAVAAEIPQAVLVVTWNGASLTTPSELCSEYDIGLYVGLHRSSSSEPWSGANRPIARGEGVVIAVDAPTSWTPRRLCTSFAGGPPGNVPPVANPGGPYDQTVCDGGLLGIWLDGTASFDPDSTGTLSYWWSTTCTGTFGDRTAPLTTADFDCDPCVADQCEITLTVTDSGNASSSASSAVISRRLPTCLLAGNSLKMTRAGAGDINFDWTQAPPAESYLLLKHADRQQLIPTNVTCGAALGYAKPISPDTLELFRVEAFDSPCGLR